MGLEQAESARFTSLPTHGFMQLRSIALTALILTAGAHAGAQDVRVEVVESATGKPILGANVALLDSAGEIPLGGGFSDQSGRTDLRAPSRGPYRVRADKVGYDTWTSVQLQLGDRPVYVRVGMAPTRGPAPYAAGSEMACQQLTGPGTPAGDLWVELKKALTASAMTEAQGLVPLDVDLYERALDRNLAVVSEKTEQRARISRRPLTGISWDQIDSVRRGEVSSNDVYRAPDAATILSDPFVKSHCFAAIRGYGPETGLSGLEFKPARVSSQPELTGVLWLDPKGKDLGEGAANFAFNRELQTVVFTTQRAFSLRAAAHSDFLLRSARFRPSKGASPSPWRRAESPSMPSTSTASMRARSSISSAAKKTPACAGPTRCATASTCRAEASGWWCSTRCRGRDPRFSTRPGASASAGRMTIS